VSWSHVNGGFNSAPLPLLGAFAVVMMLCSLYAGIGLRKWRDRRVPAHERAGGDGMEGVFVSAVLGLMALLMGFTFSIALNRFDTRRSLVLEEANAIGTTYLRTQLLGEPHRTRMSRLLVAYTDNRVALATASRNTFRPLRAQNDRLINELWAATSAASANIRDLGLTTAYLSSMNEMIDLEAARRVARNVQVPVEVFAILFVYLLVTAAMLGYVSASRRDRVSVAVMFVLLILCLVLIMDVDRPTSGGIQEDQTPMVQLQASLRTQTPAVMDHYLMEDSRAARAGGASPIARAAPTRPQGLTR
jgi:hypothetical protein